VFGDAATASTAGFAWTTSFGVMVKAGRPRMTRPWPSIGLNGGGAIKHHWTTTPCACSPGRMAAVPVGNELLAATSHRNSQRMGTLVAAGHP